MRRATIAIGMLIGVIGHADAATPRGNEVLGQSEQPVGVTMMAATPPSLSLGEQDAGSPAEPPSGNPLWLIPLETLGATRERPLFSPTRRPFVPVVGAPPPPPPARPPLPPEAPEAMTFVLIGTVVSDGTDSIAVLVDPTTRSAFRLRVGEAYNGWALREVSGRDASLEKDGRVETVSMTRPDL